MPTEFLRLKDGQGHDGAMRVRLIPEMITPPFGSAITPGHRPKPGEDFCANNGCFQYGFEFCVDQIDPKVSPYKVMRAEAIFGADEHEPPTSIAADKAIAAGSCDVLKQDGTGGHLLFPDDGNAVHYLFFAGTYGVEKEPWDDRTERVSVYTGYHAR
jgi:hypothetical protein